ncbi:MAG TPA: hypothetical protein VIE69_02000 [Methylophilaceae bacterium]|jgi:hypothetical protein
MAKYAYVVVLVVILSGCAAPAAVEKMTATHVDTTSVRADSPLKNGIAIKSVSGGTSTNPMWLSKVGDDNFKKALQDSLQSAQLLAPDGSNGNYVLDVKLLSLDQPFAGLDLKVTAKVEYVLQEISSGKKILVATIVTPFTATFSDAALAFVRLKIANEGAIRVNIEDFIKQLVALDSDK